MKKILAILLAMSMLLALAVPVVAAEDPATIVFFEDADGCTMNYSNDTGITNSEGLVYKKIMSDVEYATDSTELADVLDQYADESLYAIRTSISGTNTKVTVYDITGGSGLEYMNANDFMLEGSLWGRSESFDNITLSDLISYAKQGYTLKLNFQGGTYWGSNPIATSAQFNAFDNAVSFDLRMSGYRKYEATVSLAELLAKSGEDGINNFVIQPWCSDFLLYKAWLEAPAEVEEVPEYVDEVKTAYLVQNGKSTDSAGYDSSSNTRAGYGTRLATSLSDEAVGIMKAPDAKLVYEITVTGNAMSWWNIIQYNHGATGDVTINNYSGVLNNIATLTVNGETKTPGSIPSAIGNSVLTVCVPAWIDYVQTQNGLDFFNNFANLAIQSSAADDGSTIVAINNVYVTGTVKVENPAFGVATIGETKYRNLDEAVAAAKSGDTIKLMRNTEADLVLLYPGLTLDLNGYTLTADKAVSFNTAHIVDNSEAKTGLLAVDEDSLSIGSANNAQMPLLTDNGYAFATMKMQQRASYDAENDALSITLKPSFGTVFNSTFADGMADKGVKVVIRVSWTDGNTTVNKDFRYNEDFVKTVYTANSGFSFTATGLGNYSDVTVTVMVISDLKVECAGESIVPTAIV